MKARTRTAPVAVVWRDRTLIGLVVLLLPATAWFASGAGSLRAQALVCWTGELIVHVGLIPLCWQVVRECTDHPGARRVWTGVGFAGTAFALGDLDQLRLLVRGPVTVGLTIGGFFQTLCVLVGTAGLVLLMLACPVGLTGLRERVRFGLDTAVVMTAAVPLSAFTYIPPNDHGHGGRDVVLAVVTGPLVFLVGTFAVVRLLLGPRPPFSTGAGWAAAGAALLEAVAQGSAGALIDAGRLPWLFLLTLLASGLLLASAGIQHGALAGARFGTGRRPRRRYSLLPYAAILVTDGLLCWAIATSHQRWQLWSVVGATVLSGVLVVIRQLSAFAESAQLLDQLDERVRELHQSLAEQDRLAEQLQFQAFHDPLTGLANRALFSHHLQRALAARLPVDRRVALMVLDLDGFKAVNDTHGHATGDSLLVTAAGRLRACVREGDLVARLGGDEFAVLAEVSVDGVKPLADRIVADLARPYELPGVTIDTVGASLGIAVAGTDADGRHRTPEELVHEADHAMYEVKRAGKGGHRIRT